MARPTSDTEVGSDLPESSPVARRSRHWDCRDITSAGVFIIILVALVAIPLWQLQVPFEHRAVARFGWQMYARDHAQPTFEAHWPDGRSETVASRFRLRTWWGDFGYREALVRDLCAMAPQAVRITGSKPAMADFREEYRCP